MSNSKSIVILTNIMTPYRKFFYDKLYYEFKKHNFELTIVLMANSEDGRHWKYDDFKTNYTYILESKTKKIGNIEIHFNKGLNDLYDKLKPVCVICGGSYLYPSVWKTIKLQKKYGYILFEWSESHLNETRNYNKLKLFFREIMRKKVIGRFKYFWNPGEYAMDFVKKYSPSGKCLYVPNLIDTSKFYFDRENIKDVSLYEKFELSREKRNFITPARLTAVKGILEFLELYKECENKNARYILVGDGELKSDIQKYIQENNLDVHLIGYRSEEEMVKLYSLCDGVILPSLSDANPLTSVEAIWNGLPLLVSVHVGNYPEVVSNGENGYVFDYKLREESIKIINKFINQTDKWKDNAKRVSLNIADKMYNPAVIIPQVVNSTLEIIYRNESNANSKQK